MDKTPKPKAQGTSQKRGQKDWKGREPGSLLQNCIFYKGQGSQTHKISTRWLPKKKKKICSSAQGQTPADKPK